MQTNNNKYIVSLVDSTKKGSKNAFLQLCELNLSDVYSLCLMLTADAQSAYDFTKKVFLDAWKNIRQMRVNASFNSWLHGFAIYYVLQEIRKKEAEEKIISETNTVKWGKARQSYIGNYLVSLGTWERIAVILHDLEKYSYDEINDLLWQFSPEEVKNLVKSGRKKYLMGRNGLS